MIRPTPLQEAVAAAVAVCVTSWALIGWAAVGGAIRLWRKNAVNDDLGKVVDEG